MGVPAKIYSLDGGKVKITVEQIMAKVKIGKSAARHRLKQSKLSKIVLAPKGAHVIGGHNKHAALELSIKYKNPDAVALKKRALEIKNKHPFYAKDEVGKLHRLLFGSWQSKA